jgi:hypothetical protein
MHDGFARPAQRAQIARASRPLVEIDHTSGRRPGGPASEAVERPRRARPLTIRPTGAQEGAHGRTMKKDRPAAIQASKTLAMPITDSVLVDAQEHGQFTDCVAAMQFDSKWVWSLR